MDSIFQLPIPAPIMGLSDMYDIALSHSKNLSLEDSFENWIDLISSVMELLVLSPIKNDENKKENNRGIRKIENMNLFL